MVGVQSSWAGTGGADGMDVIKLKAMFGYHRGRKGL